jgi:hypothetical protein
MGNPVGLVLDGLVDLASGIIAALRADPVGLLGLSAMVTFDQALCGDHVVGATLVATLSRMLSLGYGHG